MQANRFTSGKKGANTVGRELLKFTGERLPQYGWLQKVYHTEEAPGAGGGLHGEPGSKSTKGRRGS
jgi:hypothetical protein